MTVSEPSTRHRAGRVRRLAAALAATCSVWLAPAVAADEPKGLGGGPACHAGWPGGLGAGLARPAGAAAAHRPGAVGRRCARGRAHRRAQGAGRVARADRCDRRHQHGLDRRRLLCVGADGGEHDGRRGQHQDRDAGPRPAAAPGDLDPPEAGRLARLHRAAVRLPRRLAAAAQGGDHRRGARSRAARPGAGQGRLELRQAADPVPRHCHRRGHRPDDGAEVGRPGHCDARQHVGAGRDRPGADRRQDAGRRRPDAQPAGGRGAGHGCRRDHRGQPGHAAAASASRSPRPSAWRCRC